MQFRYQGIDRRGDAIDLAPALDDQLLLQVAGGNALDELFQCAQGGGDAPRDAQRQQGRERHEQGAGQRDPQRVALHRSPHLVEADAQVVIADQVAAACLAAGGTRPGTALHVGRHEHGYRQIAETLQPRPSLVGGNALIERGHAAARAPEVRLGISVGILAPSRHDFPAVGVADRRILHARQGHETRQPFADQRDVHAPAPPDRCARPPRPAAAHARTPHPARHDIRAISWRRPRPAPPPWPARP